MRAVNHVIFNHMTYPLVVETRYSGVNANTKLDSIFEETKKNPESAYVTVFYASAAFKRSTYLQNTSDISFAAAVFIPLVCHSKMMIGVTQENENVCDAGDGAVPNAIQADRTEDSELSNITVEGQICPPTPCANLTPPECGMPKTPPRRVLIMPSDEALEEGYDSDGNLGPFMSESVEDDRFVSMNETAPEAPTDVTPPPADEVESAAASAAPCLDEETMNKMKVSELRNALHARGLSKNGLKAVLLDRLKAAVAEGVPLVADRPAVEVENTAGTDFHPSAYWKEIDPDGEDIDESIMNVDGIQFRAPTTSAEEHDAQYANRPKKKKLC